MTMDAGIDLVIDGPVARLTLARPARRNAIDTAMLAAFEAALHRLSQARGVEIVVLTGQGPSFCAGTDLKELQGLTAEDCVHWQRRTGELVERWAKLPFVTITGFNGPAIGSGAVLGMASDLRLAVEGTWFTFPEVAFGIPLTWSGIPVLSAYLGADRLKRVLLLRERIEAEEIARRDMVMRLVAPDRLEAEIAALVETLLATPHAARLMTKRAIAAAAEHPGFSTNVYEPFLAGLGVALRPDGGYDFGAKK